MSYSTKLMALGTALAKEKKYEKFTKYMPPTYLMRIGRTRMSRAMRKKVAEKIGEKLHCSKKRAVEQFGYFRMMSKKGVDFGLENEEVKFLKK